MLVPVFCCLFVLEKLFGGVSRNRLKIYMNHFYEETKTAPVGDLQGAHRPRRPPGAVNPLTVARAHLGASPRCPFAYKLPSSRKPSTPDHIFQKISKAAAVANPRAGGI